MIATPDIDRIIGSEAVDTDGDKIGKVSQVYIDAETERPTWASVKTGLFGMSETLVPLDNASWDRDVLHVGVDKARVKDAPRVDPDAEISPEEQQRLYSYYGLSGSGAGREGGFDRGTGSDFDRTGTAGYTETTGSDRDRFTADDRGDTSGRARTSARSRSRAAVRACASTSSPSSSGSTCPSRARRCGSSVSRSPTPTSARP
jgi:hypothetical protein